MKLDKHNINAITNSPFEEFITSCIGRVINDRRLVRLAVKERYKLNNYQYVKLKIFKL